MTQVPNAPRLFRRAISAYENGDLARSEKLCKATLSKSNDFFDAVHLLGVIKSKRRHFSDALLVFDKALILRPRNPDLLNNRGTAFAEIGKPAEALKSYDRALEYRSDFASAHNNRGCVLMTLERHEEALASYGKALVITPDCAEYMNNLGRALTKLRRYDDALACYDDALQQEPDYADALLNRAKTLEELRCFDEAVLCYTQILETADDKVEALLRRAGALNGAKRFADALLDQDEVLRLKPERHDTLLARGSTLVKLGRIDEAFAGFDRAETLGVDLTEVLINRCIALNDLNRLDEAMVTSEQAIARKPDHADAHNLRGLVLMNMERFDEAIEAFRHALELRPNFTFVQWNLAYLALLRGHYAEGWRQYEARRRQEGTRWTRLDGPEWRGEPLNGKRILLYAEQGFGDVIQFARYAGVLAAMGATVILGVYAPLAKLLHNADGQPEITIHGEHTPPYHYHLPLMSVPGVLGHDQNDTPAQAYLKGDDALTAAWAERLPSSTFKIGIAWQGSAAIPGRSLPLETFRPLSRLPGVSLISLQKSDGLDQLAALPADMKVETLGPDFDQGKDAFIDTVAVMMNLDLIISCDTAIAHLAGALGRPVWIVLKTVPDWRWMMDRLDSPWYASARLFRRKKDEEWSDTMDEISASVAELIRADR